MPSRARENTLLVWPLMFMALLAAYFLVWPLWRAQFPLEVGPTDAWNAYFQDLAFGPGLYPSPDALVLNNYPPLSFYFVAALAKLFNADALYVGRLVSIAATFGIGIAAAFASRHLGSKRDGCVLAGLWIVAILARSFHSYVGRDDPQLLAEFLMLLGLVWFLRNMARERSVLAPLLWMAFAGFFKHNIIAMPLTAVIWLLLKERFNAVRPLAVVLFAVAAGLMACALAYPDFMVSLLAPRAYIPMRVLTAIGRLQWVAPALVIFLLWAWPRRREDTARFMLIYTCIALVAYLMQWVGSAVVDNAQFDLVIATAIGLGLAYSAAAEAPLARRIGARGVKAAIVAILAVRLLATGRVESAYLLFDPDYRAQFRAHAAIARAEAARIAKIPGPVYCTNDVVCRMAGKPFMADDYKIEEMRKMGLLTTEGVHDLLRQRGVTSVLVDPAASADSLDRDLFQKSPAR